MKRFRLMLAFTLAFMLAFAALGEELAPEMPVTIDEVMEEEPTAEPVEEPVEESLAELEPDASEDEEEAVDEPEEEMDGDDPMLLAAGPDAYGNVEINEENFPDLGFSMEVSNYDLNDDGMLSPYERAQVTFMDFEGLYPVSAKSVEGIQYFTELEYLNCSSNPISGLDLSGNPKLKVLKCNYISKNFTELDLRGNPLLTRLECRGNPGLRSVDVSCCPDLEWLDANITSLRKVNVARNPLLRYLAVSYSPGLGKIDVSQNPCLEKLVCTSTGLTKLDVTHNPNLLVLDCSLNELTGLNLRANPMLEYLNCWNNRLTRLNVTHNPLLTTLWCHRNAFRKLDVSYCPALAALARPEYEMDSDRFDQAHNADWNVPRAYMTNLPYGDGGSNITCELTLDADVGVYTVPGDPASDMKHLSLEKSGKLTVNLADQLEIDPGAACKAIKSSNTAVAKAFISCGIPVVTAKKAGKADITLTLPGKKTRTLKLTVVDPTVPRKVALDQTGTVKLYIGATMQLNAAIAPDTALGGVGWKSSNTKIAPVKAGLVTAKKAGAATITAITKVARKQASVKVKVLDPNLPASIALEEAPETLVVGDKLPLSVVPDYVRPDLVTRAPKLTWKSSNTKVATVSKSGVVTAKKAGRVKITVTTGNNKKAFVILTVVKPAAGE